MKIDTEKMLTVNEYAKKYSDLTPSAIYAQIKDKKFEGRVIKIGKKIFIHL